MVITNLGIHGATGRMGKTLIQICETLHSCRIMSQYSPHIQNTSLQELCINSEVIIDFSHPDALEALIEQALIHNKPLLIGTTGLNAALFSRIREAAKYIPIIYAANTSIGITMLRELVKTLIMRYKYFDITILDIHHRYKLDSPSGTALMLKDIMERILIDEGASQVIACCSVRNGNTPGEHQIIFSTPNEKITLTHQAYNRQCFAEGAIKGAMWLKHQSPGLYDIAPSLSAIQDLM